MAQNGVFVGRKAEKPMQGMRAENCRPLPCKNAIEQLLLGMFQNFSERAQEIILALSIFFMVILVQKEFRRLVLE